MSSDHTVYEAQTELVIAKTINVNQLKSGTAFKVMDIPNAAIGCFFRIQVVTKFSSATSDSLVFTILPPTGAALDTIATVDGKGFNTASFVEAGDSIGTDNRYVSVTWTARGTASTTGEVLITMSFVVPNRSSVNL